MMRKIVGGFTLLIMGIAVLAIIVGVGYFIYKVAFYATLLVALAMILRFFKWLFKAKSKLRNYYLKKTEENE